MMRGNHVEAISAYTMAAKRRRKAAGGQTQVAPSSPTGPTKERASKAPEGVDTDVAGDTQRLRYRIRSALEQYAPHFTAEETSAAAAFLADAEAATRVNITSKYDGMSSGQRGSKIGGVGANEHLRDAHRRHSELWAKLPPKTKEVLTALVLEVRAEATGKVASVQEVGQAMTRFKDKATARGVGIGVLKASLWIVEWLRRPAPYRTPDRTGRSR